MDAQIGESSACATALLCGVKTNFETVGLDARGRFEDCYSSLHSKVDSLAVWAQQEGIVINSTEFIILCLHKLTDGDLNYDWCTFYTRINFKCKLMCINLNYHLLQV